MDMSGEYRIPAPRQVVWEALNDPAILKQAITGCESLERTGENEFTASVVAKVGPVKAKFGGTVTLSDLDPPNGYRITGEGAGGAAGYAKGGAQVQLTEDGEGTVLRYQAHADVGGKLAQIGSRLIQGTAKKMADDFFSSFSQIVTARAQTTTPAAAPSPSAAPSAAVAGEPTLGPVPVEPAAPSAPAAAPGPSAERPRPAAPPAQAAASSSASRVWWAVAAVILILLILWALA
jgi:carbon monoxide dehydrogenase subunit G